MEKQEKLKKWQGLIEKYEKSELTLTDWCEKNKITKGSYHYWKKQLRLEEMQSTSTKSEEVKFIKIDPIFINPIQPAKLYVTWKELKIEISSKEDTYLVAELIKNLQQIC